jgi:hypothetical protein
MKVIITGATGMVGEGVLLTCFEDPEIIEIRSVSRRPLVGVTQPKLKEYIVTDFLTLRITTKSLPGTKLDMAHQLKAPATFGG